MLAKEEDIRSAAVLAAAREIALAVRTAPKTRGRDNLTVLVADGAELAALAAKMEEIAVRADRPRPTFARDGKGVAASQAVLLIAVKSPAYGLNCGWCGYSTCEEKAKHPGPCVFGCVDLGIGSGVAAVKLAEKHIDNRMMFSLGMAALELGWFGQDCTLALGFPLSVSGKNIFFDR